MKRLVGFLFMWLVVVISCTTNEERMAMRQGLDSLNQRNRNGQPFTVHEADSFVRFFDRHGTSNDRLLAHYLLGRAYYEAGEAPMALQCYQDAINCADTTSADMNYYVLSSTYSQMAYAYHQQLLLSYEVESQRQASYYAFRANEPYWGIYNLSMAATAFILMNKKDSAELLQKKVVELYRKYGYHQDAALALRPLIHLYTEQQGKLKEAKVLMDRYEAESGLFDGKQELPPLQRQYYYYKGLYFEGIGNLDSAENYYRKICYPGMQPVAQDPMYRGLLSVFKKRYQADSIAKYAQLYCEANDSSIALKDQTLTAQLAASYKYSRLQKEAKENQARAYRANYRLGIISFLFVLILITGLWIWRNNKEKRQRLEEEYNQATDVYQKNLHSLQLLESVHQTVIENIQQELEDTQNENKDFRVKYTKAQKTISEINEQYENKKAELEEENGILKDRIQELSQRKDIAKHLEDTNNFTNTEIVRHIKDMVNKPQLVLTSEELDQLANAVTSYYPDLMQDMNQADGLTKPAMYVCMLVLLNLRPGEIANLLSLSSQQVSNLKHEINICMFREGTARTLYNNLKRKYAIYSC